MSQEDLAERSELGVRTIRRLENGTSNPRAGTVRSLAEALSLSPAQHRELLAEVSGVPDDLPGEGRQTRSGTGAENDLVANARQQDGPGSSLERPAARTALIEAAEQLAQLVTTRWQRAEEQRPIDPHPLPVRWRPAPEDPADAADDVGGVRSATTAEATPDLSGEFTEIAEVYRRVPAGRLVVLGRAGSGKTVLAARFTLDYLRTRASGDPVPVIFDLASWDPTALVLRDWLTERLLRDYPGLVAGAPNGSTLAAALVDGGYVLPVLDGFDEMARGLHGAAVEALDTTRLPMLLTSRPEVYEEVIRSTVAVELAELTPTDLLDYLPRTARGRGGAATWNPVLIELDEHANSPAGANLAGVLSTPLMVGLACTAYGGDSGRDPAELLDTTRFPTPEALEEHLLSSFVPTVYRPRPPSAGQHPNPSWEPELVQRWLGHLARHLAAGKTSDIEWWKLGGSLRRWSRILTVVLASALVSAVVSGVSAITTSGFSSARFGTALLQGLLVSPEVGLAFGLVYGFLVVYGRVEFRPARMQVRLSGRRPTGGGLGYSYRTRFGIGLLGGFVVGLGYGPVNALLKFLADSSQYPLVLVSLIDTIVSGLIFAMAASLGFLIALVLETPVDIDSAADPAAMLAANRTAVLREVAVLVPTFAALVAVGGELLIGLLEGPVLGPLDWLPDGLVVGLVGGFTGALSYAFAFTAWGQWLIFTRLWLPLTGRLPWRVLTFLEDACDRGVLRRVGAAYQFRHARLQQHLSRSVRPLPGRNSAQRTAMSRFFIT